LAAGDDAEKAASRLVDGKPGFRRLPFGLLVLQRQRGGSLLVLVGDDGIGAVPQPRRLPGR